MKVLIYTDAHFSISSSILNRVNGYKYSSRLDHLVDSFKWMADIIKQESIDMIINCGDLTDSDLLHAEENAALSEALSYNPGVPEHYILGNHEIKDKNSTIGSTSILKGYSNIHVYNEITDLQIDDHTHFMLVPFNADPSNYDKLYDMLGKTNPDDKYYIFSHMSYIGENYNNYVVTEGLDKIRLTSFYPNVEQIFNGHIHDAKSNDNDIYNQIGALMGSSFGDNYSGGLPGIIILNTDTGEFHRLSNPHAVLFFKVSCTSIKDLTKNLIGLKVSNELCLRIDVPADIKDQVAEYIEQNKSKYNILEYRIKAKYEKVSNNSQERIELSSYRSPYDALKGFIEVQSSLPYEKDDMIGFLDKYIGG